MDRFAIFVDAGYLHAAGGQLCHNTPIRNATEMDIGPLIAALRARTEEISGIEYLRTYWYDGASEGIPTAAQNAVANLRGVKLRLGRMDVQGRQKGVDSLIVRDLMRLAGEHAVATAFVVSGDEDIRQGVIEAQDYGIKVILLAIKPIEGNVSRTLLREADDILTLDETVLAPFFKLVTPVEDEQYQPRPAGQWSPSSGGYRPDVRPAWVPATAATWPSPPEPGPYTVGWDYGEEWMRLATPPERERLAEMKSMNPALAIPQELDRELLGRARPYVNGAIISQPDRKLLRDGFWDALNGE